MPAPGMYSQNRRNAAGVLASLDDATPEIIQDSVIYMQGAAMEQT